MPSTTIETPLNILAPARPRWNHALAAVLRRSADDPQLGDSAWLRAALGTVGITDPQEAWEVLCTHGLLDEGALDDPGRRFVAPVSPPCPECVDLDPNLFTLERWCAGCGISRRGASPVPVTVADAVTLAADWPGVLAAEKIALTYQRKVCKYENGSRYWSRQSSSEVTRWRGQFAKGRGDRRKTMNKLLLAIDERGYMLDRIRRGGVLLLFAFPDVLPSEEGEDTGREP